MMDWIKANGAPEQKVDIQTLELPAAGRPLDMTIAKIPLQPGDVALSIPDKLVVTLEQIFEDETFAELLTTGKLSELACLTLYLMYEKKVGKKSFWYSYIKELDRQRARGVQAVESPLLWSTHELEDLLQGSPVIAATKARLAGIQREYEELDTVWFMAGSLFNRYPFDIPTEAFSFNLFKQAFAAVQASIVHLQGVAPARRFALVPLGPPLLSYSSTCKGMLTYNQKNQSVELVVDRAYSPGEPVYAWCGPQSNSRLLINYGIVDETNPYDKMQMTVTLSDTDPLYRQKRSILAANNLASMQTFDLQRNKPLPPMLLPYMRLAYLTEADMLNKVVFAENAAPVDAAVEQTVVCQLIAYLERQIASYKHPLWKDLEIINDPAATPRQKIAARLTKIEKSILQAAIDHIKALPTPCTGADTGVHSSLNFTVKLS